MCVSIPLLTDPARYNVDVDGDLGSYAAAGSWRPDPTGRWKLRWQLHTGEWTHQIYSADGIRGMDRETALPSREQAVTKALGT